MDKKGLARSRILFSAVTMAETKALTRLTVITEKYVLKSQNFYVYALLADLQSHKYYHNI